MKEIIVVDAMMGRGKSSAAIRYMNEHKGRKKFLYITPYLKEVNRICERCDFDQPDGDKFSKTTQLKNELRKGHNVAATHSLFYLMDDEMLQMVREKGYSLIIDECINVIEKMPVSSHDFNLITDEFATEASDGSLTWINKEYEGKFSGYKEVADVGSLFRLEHGLYNILNPRMFESFEEVYMMTYLFNGQYQKAYLDFFNVPYKVVGVENDGDSFRISDKPDDPPYIDYGKLINLIDDPKMNKVGDAEFSLSKNWYGRRSRKDPEITKIRNCMNNFFKHKSSNSSENRLWTCFKEGREKLVGSDGRYKSNFLQIGAKASNEYRNKTDVAYMANKYADPTIKRLFAKSGASIDEDIFALSEMIQWIWRSAIRDGKPINLYIPSKRMRELFINWIEEVKNGSNHEN